MSTYIQDYFSFEGSNDQFAFKDSSPVFSGGEGDYVIGVKGEEESEYRHGNVNITRANLGLENVDNTSDLNKPISTATQAALDAKQDAMTAITHAQIDALF